jgi:hypothetical protein
LDNKVFYAHHLPDVVSHLFDTGSDTGRRTRRLLQPRKAKRIDQGNLFHLFYISRVAVQTFLLFFADAETSALLMFFVSTPQPYTCSSSSSRSIDINGGGGAVRNFKLLIRK